ncbi:MAG: ferredoxin-dependent glutamate synthase [Firmicutes bacterium]|nr:ferredoxin-dependent glutamate synthase [Bacillota bacterium]
MQIIITNPAWGLVTVICVFVILIILILLIKPILRYSIKKITNHALEILLTDKYTQNLAEFLPSLKRFSVLNAIELSLRTEEGQVITRPLGSPKHFLGYENLMFSPTQMTKLPLTEGTPVNMSVTIGPTAEKPLTISMPLMISAMGYGLALSEEAKRALARAAKKLQTVTNSGEGPYLPEEREEADKYVLQICRWSWGERTNEQIAAADMLEVQMGQGADIGTARIKAKELQGRAQELAGIIPGQSPASLPAPPGVQKPEDWPAFMKDLRKKANGIPIALKLMATDHLEEDLSIAVDLGVDVVVIDGAGGGSHASTPIKQDDFGIPSLYALIRAKRFLANRPISLIIAGGHFTPGQCLKALALGADAIYLGTLPLFALAHNQSAKVTPWEPLTTLVYYDSPTKTQLNIEQAADNVVKLFTSMVLEMQEAMLALGKTTLKQLTPEDLVALDTETSCITGVKLAFGKRQISEKPENRISDKVVSDFIIDKQPMNFKAMRLKKTKKLIVKKL